MIEWNKYFDHIYCVHFLPYKDRLAKIKSELKRVGILDSGIFSWQYTWDTPFYDILSRTSINKALSVGYMKCGLAQYYCHKEAYDLGYNRILVLEDDISFLKDLDKIKEILEATPEDYDLVLYDNTGRNPAKYHKYRKDNQINDFFCHYDNDMILASCYGVSRNFMKHKIECEERALNTNDKYMSYNPAIPENPKLKRAFATDLIACQNPNFQKSLNLATVKAHPSVKLNTSFYDSLNELDYNRYNIEPVSEFNEDSGNKTFWDENFDKIYCIHYIPSKERVDKITSELERVGILESSNFQWKYSTFYGNIQEKLFSQLVKEKKTALKSHKRMNAALTHYACIKEAYESGAKNVLIIENDVIFLKDVEKIKEIITSKPDRDIILFDYMPQMSSSKLLKLKQKSINNYANFGNGDDIFYVSCYALSRKGMEYIIKNQEIKLRDGDNYTYVNPAARYKKEITRAISMPRLCYQRFYSDCLTYARDHKDTAKRRYLATWLKPELYGSPINNPQKIKKAKTEGCGKEKNIVVLSMSCNKSAYVKEEKGVRDSWAKDIIEGKYKNIEWYSYRGGKSDSYDEIEHCKHINVSDDYRHTFQKTIKMFEWVIANNKNVDYIVRTNTSNYINIPLVNDFIKNLPYNDENMYCGEICCCPWFGHKFYGRGNFMLFSRATIDAIIKFGKEIPDNRSGNLTDDYTIFSVLEKNVFNPRGEYGKNYLKQVPMTYMMSPKNAYSYDNCKDNLVINLKVVTERNRIPEKMTNLHQSIKDEKREFILPTNFNEGKVHYIGQGRSGRIPYNEALKQAKQYYNVYCDKPSKNESPETNTTLKFRTNNLKRSYKPLIRKPIRNSGRRISAPRI